MVFERAIAQVITVDKNPAFPKATKELIIAKNLPEIVKLQQIKYLNNIVEQDHCGIKRESGCRRDSSNTIRRTSEGMKS